MIRYNTTVAMTQARTLGPVSLDASESGVVVRMTRNASWNRANQRIRVRLTINLKDGTSQQFVSGDRSGTIALNRDGSQRTVSTFGIRYRKNNGPDNVIQSATVAVEPVQGSPNVSVVVETI